MASHQPILALIKLSRTRILKRIPRASRDQASAKLTPFWRVWFALSVAWERLLWCPSRCLRVAGIQSLATQVNKQLREEVDQSENVNTPNKMRAKASSQLESLG